MNDQGDWSDTHAWSCTAICGEVCSTCGRKSHLPQILSRRIRQWFSQILSNDFDINVCRNPKFPFEESTAKPTTVHAVFDSVPTFLLFVALCSLYLESRLCWIMVVPTGTLASFCLLRLCFPQSQHTDWFDWFFQDCQVGFVLFAFPEPSVRDPVENPKLEVTLTLDDTQTWCLDKEQELRDSLLSKIVNVNSASVTRSKPRI